MASCGSRPQDDGYVSLQCPIDRIAGPSDLQCPICKFFFLAWMDDSLWWNLRNRLSPGSGGFPLFGRPRILIIDFYHLIIWLHRTFLQFATSWEVHSICLSIYVTAQERPSRNCSHHLKDLLTVEGPTSTMIPSPTWAIWFRQDLTSWKFWLETNFLILLVGSWHLLYL